MSTTETIRAWSTVAASNANSDAAIASSDTQAPNTVANNIRSIMAAAKKQMNDVGGALTAGGTANALTVTTNQVLESGQLTGGLALLVKAASTNTSATVTFTPDGLTAGGIKRADGSALAVGSIQAGMFLVLVYNSGTSEWWCANVPPIQSITGISTTKVTWDTVAFNVGSFFSTVNSRWTPPAGTVLMSAELQLLNGTGADSYIVSIFKNGSQLVQATHNVTAAIQDCVTLTAIDQCNGTDFYEVDVQSGGNITYIVKSNLNFPSFFCGTMI
jgi:hypothetical protein